MTQEFTTVCLTFDFDALSVWLGSDPSLLRQSSRGGNMVRAHSGDELPATFFVPGHAAESFPESLESILAAGHELAYHPSAQSAHEERRSLEQGLAVLEGLIEHVLSVGGARVNDVALALTAAERG
jgi:hypothetical protein